MTRAIPVGSYIPTCDNSGAKLIKVFTVMGMKTRKGRYPAAGIGDLVMASVKRAARTCGSRSCSPSSCASAAVPTADGTRVKFEDNAAVVLKDE